MFLPEHFYQNVFPTLSSQSVVAIFLSKHHSNVVIETFVQRCFNALNKISIQHHNYNYFSMLTFRCNSDVVSNTLFLSKNKDIFFQFANPITFQRFLNV